MQAEDRHGVANRLGVSEQRIVMTTNRHGVAVFNFATVSGCDQLVVGPTHARGGTLCFLMTDVPNLEQVVIVAPLGISDHSSLSAVITMAQAVPKLVG